MGQISFETGKYLEEPCSPYRRAEVFGAALNSPSTAGWNCLPRVGGIGTVFDLSTIADKKLNCEVVVALGTFAAMDEGTYRAIITFQKVGAGGSLYAYQGNLALTPYATGWITAWIGWYPGEIEENGDYQVNLSVWDPSGQGIYSKWIQFEVIGIPPGAKPQPTPAPLTGVLAYIVETINNIAAFFYDAYTNALDWVWPFNYLADVFYAVSEGFTNFGRNFIEFSYWVRDVADKIIDFFSFDQLEEWFLEWKQRILDAWNWVIDAWNNVTDIVGNWWNAAQTEVKGWIDNALDWVRDLKQDWDNFFNNLWVTLRNRFDQLSADWSNFWTVTLPELLSWDNITSWWTARLAEVLGLFESTLKEWFPWYDELAAAIEDIVEFFSNPLEYIKDRLEDWFWGPG